MLRTVRNYLALGAVVVAMVVGTPRPADAIAHGDRPPAGKYQFSAKLTMIGIPTGDGGSRDSWCSGSLVAPRWVITAGHCFRDAGGKHVSRTVARRTTATVGARTVPVIAAYQAPDHDVALAELSAPISGVRPIRVGTEPPRVGDRLRLTGFGALTGDEDAASPGLRTGVFEVDGVRDTTLDMSGARPADDTSACPHDSGGPYFREGRDGTATLLAVVSTGPLCPHAGADFAARTDQLAGWISGTMTDPPSTVSWWLVGSLGAGALALVAVVVVALRRNRRRGPRGGAHVSPAGHRVRI
ncbi:S1 family peptidase [Actinoplanes sp. KI2]|uniref:S1 family peptidase n=1 Tax=Actinoplanes sp. KI2 TaxID=2983315 RepID=UPI0021D5C113|nr:S1 family peptidase [Actinoplanes sp. KI2]MCU7726852.1 S1 family peptidase [Actinoplanes sp. KI2]